MNRKTLALLIAVVTFAVGIVVAKLSLRVTQHTIRPDDAPTLPVSNYKLSGPYSYDNLTIFLIHGPDQFNSKLFTPLQEAMDRKVLIVHETSEVNELAIENVSQ